MRQFSIILLLISTMVLSAILPSYSAVKGKIEYSTSIDYRKINEQDTNIQADAYFQKAMELPDGIINNDTTNALMLYNLLQKISPGNPEYSAKLAALQGKIGKDDMARKNFTKAINIDSKNPITYFYLGEFYYKREFYFRALKCYCETYKYGQDNDYYLLYKMGNLYEKLGDTRLALKFLYEAQSLTASSELDEKIQKLEVLHTNNTQYYSDNRLKG